MNKNCFIIAEMSANHCGDIEIAKETIRAAKRAGANAVKIQTFTSDTITLNCKHDDFRLKKGSLWENKYLYELYNEAHLPWEWHKELFDLAKKEEIIIFSSPFDKTAVDFLEKLNCPIYKIASFEITDIPLIKYIAKKQKPIIISTGIASYNDISLAIDTCRKEGNNDITILKCTSSYPAPIDEANLKLMTRFANDFDVKIGLSDHTIGSLVPILSVAMGAKVIEKHFKLNDSTGGPDASFSVNENDFKSLVDNIRMAELALGSESYELTEKQISAKSYSRSLYVSADVKKGDIVSVENVKSVRPGYGLHPKYFDEVINKKYVKNISKGTRFSLDLII